MDPNNDSSSAKVYTPNTVSFWKNKKVYFTVVIILGFLILAFILSSYKLVPFKNEQQPEKHINGGRDDVEGGGPPSVIPKQL